MANKPNIKNVVGKLIATKKIKILPLSPQEKEDLKSRIQLAIRQMENSNT